MAENGDSGRHVGVIGLAVMGENLALNIERNGFPIAVFNRTGARTKEFAEGPAAGRQFTPTYTLEEFVAAIDRPRKIILMVQAGKPVDEQIARLKPLLEDGDILADAGNSLFQDTERRSAEPKYGLWGSRPSPSRLSNGLFSGQGLHQ